MSSYEDYSKVSEVYDKERLALGADVVAGLLHVYGGKPLKELHLLDAGCGTGNYSKALIELGVGKVTLMDANEGMLGVAKEKLRNEMEKGVVEHVVEAKVPPLPFKDGSFDVVFFSVVLHHADNTGDGEHFPIMEEIFRETKRVLRPKGVMAIITCLPTGRDAIWYMKLHEKLLDRHCKLFPTVKQFLRMFNKCGFECQTKLNFLGADLWKNYLDPEGPLKKEWRLGDSLFGYATNEEIKEIEDYVRTMKENGTLEKFVEENDKTLEIGVLTLIVCTTV